MPEEFAAAYRAAYEQALAAQTDAAKHRDDPEDLAVRRGPLRIGTHRSADLVTHDEEGTPSVLERLTGSAWLVSLLLVLLAALLIFGAYSVGRSFAGRVAGDAEPDVVADVSRIIVTGPSFASSTVMSAPKTPRSTRVPSVSSPSQTAL